MKTILNLKFGQVCLFILLPLFLHCQSVSEQIGGIKTEFIIKSDTVLLNDRKQILIEKGIKNYYTYNYSGESAYGYGYGYQGIHLEFTTNREIQLQYRKKKRKLSKRNFYYLSLKNHTGDIYKEILLKVSDVRIISSVQNKYAYSINLDEIPLILLDDLLEINIVKIEEK